MGLAGLAASSHCRADALASLYQLCCTVVGGLGRRSADMPGMIFVRTGWSQQPALNNIEYRVPSLSHRTTILHWANRSAEIMTLGESQHPGSRRDGAVTITEFRKSIFQLYRILNPHISPTVDCEAGSDWFTVAERAGLLEPKKVEALQTKIINSLRDHVTYNQDAQRKPHYFSRILDKLQVGQQHREQLKRLG